MKPVLPALTFFLFAIVMQPACSSDESRVQKNDTANSSIVVPPQTGTSTTGIEPDQNFVASTEIISQYGPECIMRDVIVDRNGNVWMASWQGVIMYDQKTFTNYTLRNRLSRHRIFSLLEDSKGILWFGSMGAGVYRYDGTSFTSINSNDGLVNNTVLCIFEDDSGVMWFGTNGGVSRYDGKSFMNVSDSTGLAGSVNAISQDTNGVMWIGTSEGLFHYDGKMVTPVMTDYDTPWMNVRAIERDSKGVMWMGCPSGLYKSTISSDGKPHLTAVYSEFTGNIRKDQQGNLLITSNALYRFDGVKFDTLAPGQVNAMFGATEDDRGNVWYGAMDGLHRYDGKNVFSYSKQ